MPTPIAILGWANIVPPAINANANTINFVFISYGLPHSHKALPGPIDKVSKMNQLSQLAKGILVVQVHRTRCFSAIYAAKIKKRAPRSGMVMRTRGLAQTRQLTKANISKKTEPDLQ